MADMLCTVMVLCKGKQDDGKPFWAYVCVKPSMAKSFKEARDKGAFNLEEFGTIIEHGNGSDVPADIRKRMERDYGVKHDYESQLLKAIATIEKRHSI